MPDIRKGDKVIVLAGKDAGKQGTVERVIRPQGCDEADRRAASSGAARPLAARAVVVEGINIAKRHTKPRQSAGAQRPPAGIQQGGILDIAQPLPVSQRHDHLPQLRQADARRATRRSTTAAACASAGTAASSWRSKS